MHPAAAKSCLLNGLLVDKGCRDSTNITADNNTQCNTACMYFRTVLNLSKQQGLVLLSCLFAETLRFSIGYQPQTPGLLFEIMLVEWGVSKAQADGHRDASSFPSALGLAPSCQGLEKKAEEAVERAVPGRELTMVVETDQPQQVCVLKKPHLILLSRNNSTQQVT